MVSPGATIRMGCLVRTAVEKIAGIARMIVV